MPGIIGYNTIGGSTAATADNWLNEGYITASGKTYTAASGDGALTAWVYGDGTGDCIVGLYTVSAGFPATKIEEVTVSIGSTAGWYSAAMSSTLTPSTEYTVAICYYTSGGESWNVRYDEPGGNQVSTDDQNVGVLASTWTDDGFATGAVSYYIDVASGDPVTTDQSHFRFRNDDGSETTATWKAAEDTDVTHPLSTNLRLRLQVDTDNDLGATAFTLCYKKSTDSVYLPVPTDAGGGFPTPEGAPAETAVSTAGTSHAVTLPASIAATDGVLLIADIGSTSATLNALTDWAELLDESVANGLKILWYTGSGTPSNPTFTSSASTRSAWLAWRISGCDRSVTPQIGTTATGTSTTPNPPSVSPSGGTKNYLAITFYGAAGEEADDDTWSDASPTDYLPTAPYRKACGTAGTNLGGMIAAAYRQINTGSAIDPGTFTKDVSAAWRAQTIIIHPKPPPIYVAASSNITAGGEATTAQLTAPSGKTASDFSTGRMWDDENGTDTTDIADTFYSEFEWNLQAQSPAVDTDAYDLRIYAGSAPLDTYADTPRWTIGSGAIDLVVPDATSASTIDNVALTQVHELVVADGTSATTIDGVDLDANVALEVADATTTSTIDAVVLTQVHVLAVADAADASTIDNVALTQVHILAVGDATTASTIDAVVLNNTLYPASISGRKILDQNGDVYLAKTFSSWKMANKLSNADITTALEGVAGNGFNGVTVWCGGIEDRAAEGDQYLNEANDNFWSGTPWASGLGPAWSSVDWIVEECARLGMVLHFSFCAGFSSEGCGPDWEAATNTNMYNAGVAIATRYAAATNIVWHIMFDDGTLTGSTRGQRIQALFDGINDTEGPSTRPVRWCENDSGDSTSDAGWYQAGNFNATINCGYNYTPNSVTFIEGIYAQTAGPVGDCEPTYSGAGHYGGNEDQQMRERNFAVFLEGGCIINFGHEDWWPFGGAGLYSDGETWQTVQADDEPVQAGYAWALIDEFCATTAWAPTSSFVTTGEGSTDTKAAQGSSGLAALAYFPDNRTIQVDTTILTGTNNVQLRWFDPVANSFSTISASEAQQTGRAVTLPAARGDGTRDYVLVVELIAEATLVVADATGPSTIDNIALTQGHQLVVADATGPSTIDNLVLVQAHGLVVADVTSASTIDAVTLTQVHGLVIADVTVSATIDNVTVTQVHVLDVSDVTSATTIDNVVLSSEGDIDAADVVAAATIDNVALTQVHTLVVLDVSAASTINNVALAQTHILAIADTTSASTIDAVVLTTEGDVVAADVTSAATIDNVTLTQIHNLIVAEVAGASTIDNVTLGLIVDLVVNEVSSAAAIDPVTITVDAVNLSVADVATSSTIDALVLTQQHILVVGDVIVATTIDTIHFGATGPTYTGRRRTTRTRDERRLTTTSQARRTTS